MGHRILLTNAFNVQLCTVALYPACIRTDTSWVPGLAHEERGHWWLHALAGALRLRVPSMWTYVSHVLIPVCLTFVYCMGQGHDAVFGKLEAKLGHLPPQLRTDLSQVRHVDNR